MAQLELTPAINEQPHFVPDAEVAQQEESMLSRIQACGAQAVEFVRNSSRRALALGAIAGVGAFGASELATPETAEAKKRSWPPITQKIDGKEYGGDVSQERAIADNCKDYGKLWSVMNLYAPAPTKNSKVLKATIASDSFDMCNGYGRLTRSIRLDTKRPGEKKWHRGEAYTIKTHDGFEKKKYMKIALGCNPGETLTQRMHINIKYKHLDGSVVRAKKNSPKRQVVC